MKQVTDVQIYGMTKKTIMIYVDTQRRDQAHVQEVEGLVLESFKLWLAFLSHGLGIDKYV